MPEEKTILDDFSFLYSRAGSMSNQAVVRRLEKMGMQRIHYKIIPYSLEGISDEWLKGSGGYKGDVLYFAYSQEFGTWHISDEPFELSTFS